MAKKGKQSDLKGIKRHTALGEAAARTIAAQLDEFEERSAALRALADGDDAPSADQLRELHELRIAAKRLRYTLELFEPVLPGDAADAIDELKRLQDELGFVHDRDVLTGLALEDRRFTAERELALLSNLAERPAPRAARLAAIRSRLQEPTAPTATALGLYGLVADAADERREGLAALRERWRALAAGDFPGRLRALSRV
jgi:CHAD domain-containing protein